MKSWFENLKITRKLFLTFLLMVSFLLTAGVVAYVGMQNLNDALSQANEVRLPSIDLLLQIDRDLQQATVSERTMIFTNIYDPKYAALKKDHDDNIKQAEERWNKYVAYTQTDEEKQLVAEYEKLRDIWITNTNNVIAAIEADTSSSKAEAKALAFGAGSESFENAREIINKLTEVTENIGTQESAAGTDTFHNTIMILLITILVSTVIAMYACYSVNKVITVPLLKAKDMMVKLANGNLKTRLKLKSKDEIGEMAQAMDSMADNLTDKIEKMQKIAEGDLSIEFTNVHPEDEITPGLNRILTTLKDLYSEIESLSRAGSVGELSKRGDLSKFKGVYSSIVGGINTMLDVIISPIQEGSKVLSVMAKGDLTVRVKGDYKGDYKLMKDSINELGGSLNGLISEVNSAIEATVSASTEISSSSEQLAAGAVEQSSQSHKIASAVEEMARTVVLTSQNANRAADSSKTANEKVMKGAKTVSETKKGIDKIVESTGHTGKIISSLSNKTDQIGEIARVIDDIADQTNLLALNAAIEAARAGEQGRGFAVVADEVRKLAERTTKATREIADTIKTIQNEANEADRSMSEAEESVKSGIVLTQQVAEVLDEILKANSVTSEMINQVAAASEEQSQAAEEISRNIETINNVAAESASGTQQIAKAAEDLSYLTNNLHGLIERFSLAEGEEHILIGSQRLIPN